MKAERIVIVSLTRMGDLVQSTPLLRALRREHPDAQMSLIVLSAFADTARRLPMLDNVHEFDVDAFVEALDQRGNGASAAKLLSAFISDNRLQAPDLLLNLSHTGRSATLAALLRPRRVIGLYRDDYGELRNDSEWISYLLSIMEDRSANPFNLVEIYNKLAATPCGELEFQPTAQDSNNVVNKLHALGYDDRPLVALQPGASHASRCWPPENFAYLVKGLLGQNVQVLLVGDEREQALCEQISLECERKAASLAGKTSVGELGALLQCAALLVSNDTGTAHIAAALKTSVLGLFLGPASAKDTAPYGDDHLILEANLGCAPCDYQKVCAMPRCKQQLDAKTVLHLALSMLQDKELPRIAEDLRAYKTSLNPAGEYELVPLNAAAKAVTADMKRQRAFWNYLLNRTSQRGDTAPMRASSELLRAIGTLSEDVSAWIDDARRLQGSAASRLAAHVQRIAFMQNRLRQMIGSDSHINGFIRYLLVKWSLCRKRSLEFYLEDLSGVQAQFHRGLNFMSDSESLAQMIAHGRLVAT